MRNKNKAERRRGWWRKRERGRKRQKMKKQDGLDLLLKWERLILIFVILD